MSRPMITCVILLLSAVVDGFVGSRRGALMGKYKTMIPCREQKEEGLIRFSFRRRGSEGLGSRKQEKDDDEDGGIGDALDSAASAMSEAGDGSIAKPWRLLWRVRSLFKTAVL
jgi:hypothetical protein